MRLSRLWFRGLVRVCGLILLRRLCVCVFLFFGRVFVLFFDIFPLTEDGGCHKHAFRPALSPRVCARRSPAGLPPEFERRRRVCAENEARGLRFIRRTGASDFFRVIYLFFFLCLQQYLFKNFVDAVFRFAIVTISYTSLLTDAKRRRVLFFCFFVPFLFPSSHRCGAAY